MTLTLPAVETPVATPVETKTAPKISEALRLGAMSTKQAFNAFHPKPDKFCAMGTIMHAVGFENTETELMWEFMGANCDVSPILRDCCASNPNFTTIWAAIIHLNDGHRMPRDQIADRLAAVGL